MLPTEREGESNSKPKLLRTVFHDFTKHGSMSKLLDLINATQ